MLNLIVKTINRSAKENEGYDRVNDYIIPGSAEAYKELIPNLKLFLKIVLESIEP